jgi:hypothetical protein
MSATGEYKVTESDDARYEVGKTYQIILNSDHSYNEHADREIITEPEPEPENDGAPEPSGFGPVGLGADTQAS